MEKLKICDYCKKVVSTYQSIRTKQNPYTDGYDSDIIMCSECRPEVLSIVGNEWDAQKLHNFCCWLDNELIFFRENAKNISFGEWLKLYRHKDLRQFLGK